MPGPSKEDKEILIEPGYSISEIVAKLHDAKIITSPVLFKTILILYDKLKTPVKSGEYYVARKISPLQVIRTLGSGKSILRRLTVLEGETVYNILAKLKLAPRLIGSIEENITEGFLFPNTYFYSFQDQRSRLIIDMKRQMSDILDELMPDLDPKSPLKTRMDVIILASIIEKEALYDSEKPHIASVFINRLKLNMKLQADPTTIYAITKGKDKLGRLLRRKDLRIASEYNTYHVYGLPPTPISCPGRKSIEAVIRPLQTKDLYFVVDGTGRHRFSSNYKQHNRNIISYKQKRRSRK
jgi:UPF0755 protein